MDLIKDAFNKVSEDILSLSLEINKIKKDLDEIKNFLNFSFQTNKSNFPLFPQQPKIIFYPLRPQKGEKDRISTGNEGVPTDRPTNQQTDQQTEKRTDLLGKITPDVDYIINSLDNLKKEIRLKFKKLTDQEMLVFSTIFQLEEEKGFTTYKDISFKLNLTESSIRDYIGRLIKKGIPIEKNKINNKNIHLSISESFKKMTNLSTIIKLREL